MKLQVLKQIVGLEPLPTDVTERIRVLNFADANHVLGQMAAGLGAVGIDGKLADIFENALLRCAHDHRMLTFELERLERALSGLDIVPVLLKGGAYVASGHPVADGRRVSDLDILVKEEELEAVENALEAASWQPDAATDTEYDQYYYRQWMHELPPLRHKKRGTVIDVHHLLLPRTSRIKIDNAALYAAAVPVPDRRLKTLSVVDQFVHSAVHIFADGAIDAPARSFVELYLLFKELSVDQKSEIAIRARSIGAAKPVYMALWAVGHYFGDAKARDAAKSLFPGWRFMPLKWAVSAKVRSDALSAPAKAYLYLRSHYLRMPLWLLVPHLVRKALRWRPGQQQPVELPFP